MEIIVITLGIEKAASRAGACIYVIVKGKLSRNAFGNIFIQAHS